MKTILLVEDDVSILEMLVDLLVHETSYRITVALTAPQALAMARSMDLDLLITDYRLPGSMNGIQLYDYVHQILGLEHVPAIILSATLPEEDIIVRKLTGVRKPFDLDDFLAQIETRLASPRMEGR